MHKELLFRCLECGYLVYTDEPERLLEEKCPGCGAEPFENYIFASVEVFAG